MKRLASLIRYPALAEPAKAAWRQALLWAGNSPQVLDQLDTFLARYPDDREMAERRATLLAARPDPAGAFRLAGYKAMREHQPAAAERAFHAALDVNAQDVDSLAMLAILQREAGHPAEAQELLDRALALAPDRRAELLAAAAPPPPAARTDAASASRRAYAHVQALADAGNYAAAEAELHRLMGRRRPRAPGCSSAGSSSAPAIPRRPRRASAPPPGPVATTRPR